MAYVYYSGPAVQVNSGQILSGHRVVSVIGNDAVYADKDDDELSTKVRGITLGASLQDALSTIQISGPLTNSGWSWIPELPIFLGADGNLTQAVPTTGNLVRIGVADTATRIYIAIEPRIRL